MDEHRPRKVFLIQIQIKYILLTGMTERILLQKQSLYTIDKKKGRGGGDDNREKAYRVEYRKYHRIHCTSKSHFHRNRWIF